MQGELLMQLHLRSLGPLGLFCAQEAPEFLDLRAERASINNSPLHEMKIAPKKISFSIHRFFFLIFELVLKTKQTKHSGERERKRSLMRKN
jgi:hypothetical protein